MNSEYVLKKWPKITDFLHDLSESLIGYHENNSDPKTNSDPKANSGPKTKREVKQNRKRKSVR